ncbi:MAG: lactonase family protein [Dehalococcoidales bacterium]
MPSYLYVSVSGEDKILIFAVDPETGQLNPRAEVPVTGRPGNMAIDPLRQFIYVACKSDRKISTYRRNRETGELSLIGTVSLEFEPDYLAIDRKGRFLFSTYFVEGKMAVHAIGSDGIVCTAPVQWLDTARAVHSVQTNPTNKFVFVPHTTGMGGANVIFQFKFDDSTGRLTPNTPDKVIPDERVGPRYFCFHPNLDIAYFCNEAGNSVTAYRFDPSVGTLSAFQTASSLPDGYQQKSACADIQISPSGRFLYVSNRGHNSIACFAVDAITGRLTPVGQVASEAEARSFSLDPDGNFLFIAGLASGRLVSYRVNRDTGKLTPLETYAVGKAPWWVSITGTTG